MESLLSEKSKRIIGILLLEPQIKATVFEKIDHVDKYKMFTINNDGSITLGETKYNFWNRIIGCQLTIPFESFALKVWEALVNLSTGLNQKAIAEGLSREIVMKAVKEKDFNWVVERLHNVATMVAQKSQIADGIGADTAGSPALGPRLNTSEQLPRDIVININGRKQVCHFKDSVGDPMFNVELGIVGLKRVYPDQNILDGDGVCTRAAAKYTSNIDILLQKCKTNSIRAERLLLKDNSKRSVLRNRWQALEGARCQELSSFIITVVRNNKTR